MPQCQNMGIPQQMMQYYPYDYYSQQSFIKNSMLSKSFNNNNYSNNQVMFYIDNPNQLINQFQYPNYSYMAIEQPKEVVNPISLDVLSKKKVVNNIYGALYIYSAQQNASNNNDNK